MTRPGTAPPGELLGRADAELLRLESATRAVAANLVDLDDNAARKDLDRGPLTGATAAAWAGATVALAQLWDGYGMLTDLVTRARELRGQRRFTDTDRAAYVQQILGPSITMSTTTVPLARRSLLGPGQVTATCTPAELLAGMEAAFSTAVAVAVRAGEVWDRLLPATADVAGAIDTARAATRAAGGDLSSLDAADRRLRAFLSTLASDPLGCTDAELAGIREAVARADAERTSAQELRATLTRRLAAAHTLAEQVRTAAADAETARAAASGRFSVVADGATDPDLGPALAAIDALAAAGHWQLIGARLAAWTRRADACLATARAAAAHNNGLRPQRAELRGRLDGYRAKAARRGWSEHPVLSPLADIAHTLLHTAPCDLDAARGAVDAYQSAVAELSATTAREGTQ